MTKKIIGTIIGALMVAAVCAVFIFNASKKPVKTSEYVGNGNEDGGDAGKEKS